MNDTSNTVAGLAEHVAECSPMDPETLTALRGSIAKWEAIVAGTGEDDGSFNCPLCQRFMDSAPLCKGCPVRAVTDQPACRGSPYHDYVDAEEDNDEKRMAVEAQRELDFLISLLPHGETP